MAARAIPGVEVVGDTFYERTVPGHRSSLRVDVTNVGITGASEVVSVFRPNAPSAAADTVLLAAARKLGSAALEDQLHRRPQLRVPGCADAHEMVFRAIIGQQITVAAATGQLARLAELGSPLPGTAEWRWFPSNAVIAERAHEKLRGPRARIDTVQRVAAALVDGSVSTDAPFDELEATLLSMKGIGPWTAGYVLLRLGHPDILLTGDAAVRAGARSLGIDDLAAAGVHCSGWRSWLTLRCWTAASEQLASRVH